MLANPRPSFAAVFVLACSTLAVPAGAASFTVLGLLPLTRFSFPTGLSADGSVVVGYGTYSSNGNGESFRWTSGGGIVRLDDSADTGGNFANGTSADGSVVVGYGNSGSGPADFRTEAFRWSAGSGRVGLGDFPGGIFASIARGVSADGSVVAGEGYTDSDPEAFRWTAGDGMMGLGYLPGGFNSSAYAISADGSVVVGYSRTASGFEAFRWTSSSGMVGLGDGPGGISAAIAEGVSGDGSVVVGAGISAMGTEAFRWSAGEGVVGLGILPDFDSSYALGTTDTGSVVVGYNERAVGCGCEPPFSETQASIWDAGHGMRLLQDVLTDEYGLDLTGWHLARANAISADGRTIVGVGTDPSGASQGWIATIPEPSTALLFALGLAGYAARCRRLA